MNKNNFFKEWYINHRDFEIREYADRILNKELPATFKKNNVAVLAAAPNSGKTIMTIAWLEKYLIDNPSHRVLVLAHNQRELRDQFYEEIEKSSVNFSYKKVKSSQSFLNSDEQVVVTIPRTIIRTMDSNKNNHRFDLLVVDEAHHYYVAEKGMVSQIINKYRFEKQLLLTGTPAPFIEKEMNIIPVSLEELVAEGYCSDPIVTIVKTPSKIREEDINKHEELKSTIKIDSEETYDALDNLLPIVEERILEKGWKDSIEKLRKTLIVCRRIDQANNVYIYFKNLGIKSLLSTSDSDSENEYVDKFINTDAKILIVVNRAILGFNFPSLVNIIDMKYGKNINNLFQLFNRITRLHPDKKTQKYFFKIVPESLEEKYSYMLTAALSLMLEENYKKYNGYTREKLKIRVRSEPKKIKSSTRNAMSTIFRNQPIAYLDITPIFEMWNNDNTNYSWSTLDRAYGIITKESKRRWKNYSMEENYQFALNTVKNHINNETAA